MDQDTQDQDTQDQDTQDQDNDPMPKTGAEVKESITQGDDSVTDDLIKNNHNPPHRKLIGDFFHHVIKTYNDLPEEHKVLINGAVGKMVTNSVSGSKAMKDFTTNYEVYKDNVQNISNDIDTLKTGDMTQKLDTVMGAYKTYTLAPNDDE